MTSKIIVAKPTPNKLVAKPASNKLVAKSIPIKFIAKHVPRKPVAQKNVLQQKIVANIVKPSSDIKNELEESQSECSTEDSIANRSDEIIPFVSDDDDDFGELISDNISDMRNIRFEKIGDDGIFSWGMYSDFKVVIMNKNGYINTSSLINYHNKNNNKKKLFTGWSSGKNSKAYLEEVSRELEIPEKDLLMSVKNGNYHQTFTWGTYAHPEIIPHFVSWLSPAFARVVTKIVNEFFIKKVIDENEAKLKEKDQQNVLLPYITNLDIVVKNDNILIKNISSSNATTSKSIVKQKVPSPNTTERNIIVKNGDQLKKTQPDRKYVSPLNSVTTQKGTTTVKNMQFGPIDDGKKYNWGMYGEIKFVIMNENGYINTNNLTDKYNKENDTKKSYSGWSNGKNNKKFLEVLSNDLGISAHNLQVVVKPKNMRAIYLIGTYVHPKIIPYFASWVSVECAVEIAHIVYDCFTKKKADEKDIVIRENEIKIASLIKSNQIMTQTIKIVSEKLTKSCVQYDTIIERNSELFDDQITKNNNNSLQKKNKLLIKSNQNMMNTIKIVNEKLTESCKQNDDLSEEQNDDQLNNQ